MLIERSTDVIMRGISRAWYLMNGAEIIGKYRTREDAEKVAAERARIARRERKRKGKGNARLSSSGPLLDE